MKKVINGKLYDTDTAEKIFYHYSSGISYNDFRYFSETLYKKKTGEFFLNGEGGAMSKYAEHCGNNCMRSSTKNIPLSEQETKDYFEKYLTFEEYEKHFGKVEE